MDSSEWEITQEEMQRQNAWVISQGSNWLGQPAPQIVQQYNLPSDINIIPPTPAPYIVPAAPVQYPGNYDHQIPVRPQIDPMEAWVLSLDQNDLAMIRNLYTSLSPSEFERVMNAAFAQSQGYY